MLVSLYHLTKATSKDNGCTTLANPLIGSTNRSSICSIIAMNKLVELYDFPPCGRIRCLTGLDICSDLLHLCVSILVLTSFNSCCAFGTPCETLTSWLKCISKWIYFYAGLFAPSSSASGFEWYHVANISIHSLLDAYDFNVLLIPQHRTICCPMLGHSQNGPSSISLTSQARPSNLAEVQLPHYSLLRNSHHIPCETAE